MNSVVLTTPAVLVLSVFAIILSISVTFIKKDNLRVVFFIASFLMVMANIVYMLLLGAQWRETLIYVLLFLFIQCGAGIQLQRNQEDKTDVDKKDAIDNQDENDVIGNERGDIK